MASRKFKIKIGVDPEFFLINRDVQTLVSAHGLVPGTKDQPFPLRNGAVQLDGTAVEFNTKPVSTAKQFLRMNKSVLAQVRKIVPKNYEFNFSPTVHYDHVYYERAIPDKQKELGCTPDFNAWTGKVNPTPTPPKGKHTMRTASGHIHIGWTSGADVHDISHFWDCCAVVKMLDMTVGRFIHFWDKDTERASLYGKWGAFRPKPYGVEWRVPSNAWLAYPKLWAWLFDAIKCVVTRMHEVQKVGFGTLPNCLRNYCDDWRYQTDPLNHLKTLRMFFPDFPEFPSDFAPTKKVEESRVKEPFKGIRVAATAEDAPYDLDLDLPIIPGKTEYASPKDYVSNSNDDYEEDGDSVWD